MHLAIKEFIENHINLIEAKAFTELEDMISIYPSDNGFSKSELYEVLLRAGINPLNTLGYVPYGFLRNTSLGGTFIVPGHCRSIVSRAFYACNFSEIILQEGVDTIQSLAFAQSANLRRVSFPSTLSNIDNLLFVGCNNIEEINYNGTYDEFNNLRNIHKINNTLWFSSTPVLARTNCILKCIDKEISLRSIV